MQTVVQKAPAIRKGSVRVLVGTSTLDLVDVGALRKPKISSGAQQQNIEFDNVADLKQFSEGDKAVIEFDLGEINLTNWAVFDAGMVTQTTVAGSSTPITGEAKGTGWTQGKPFRLNNKNGDNTIVSSIVIKENAVTLVLNTDYRTYVADGTNGENGYTYIVPVSARTLAITADYSYTPAASKRVTLTNQGSKVLKYVRITNADSNGKNFQIDLQNATNIEPWAFTFASDDEADVAIMPVKLEGYVVNIIDEQQIL